MTNRLLPSLCVIVAMSANASPAVQAVLDIKGMNCAACPITVKAVLMKQPGVENVRVDARTHSAAIRFDSDKISAEKLAQAVTEAGYPTTPRK